MAIREPVEVPPAVDPAFAAGYGFPFDDFQSEAMAHIRDGSSVMVAAPTSAGKTVIAEYGIWRTVNSGRKAIYTTPIKALSNQKHRDLATLFPGRVGLLTGDRTENRDAAVVVMTTEVLRNILLEDPQTLEPVGCVVFDEVHYLADPDRGTIWEESIITCPRHVQLVCLSATIANAEEVAGWISQTHRPIRLVRHDERPVPLQHYAFTGGALRLIRDGVGTRVGRVPGPQTRGRKRPMQPNAEAVVQALDRAQLLPAIWFAFTRRGVELDSEHCAEARPELYGRPSEEVEAAIAWTLAAMPREDRSLPQISELARLLRHGVGFHHAGLLPPCKELVEDLFLRGLLSVVCATDTLSVGINMPARTVVISSMTRPVAGLLTPNDFSQLTGRAGRRGIDQEGAVVLLPSPFHDFERSYAALTAELEPIRSAFTLRYSTMLSLLAHDPSEDRLSFLVRSSLRQYQLYGDARAAEARLATTQAQLEMLPSFPGLLGREEDLEQYLELQRRLTSAERSRTNKPIQPLPARRRRARRRPTGRSNHRADREISVLRTLLRSHPMHSVFADPRFRAAGHERIELLRQKQRLSRAVEEANTGRERDAEQTARGVRAVLSRLGYVDERGLRHKAAGLREIVAPAGLVLSEMYHAGMLTGLDPAELAEATSWFASDVDRRRYNTFRLPPELRRLHGLAELVFQRISGIEEAQGIRLAQGPSNWFWGVALAWCQGDPVERIVLHIEMGEGDIVSTLNKTVDLLDQVRDLAVRYSDEPLLERIDRARRLLCRGLVAMIRNGESVFPENEHTLA